MKSPQDKAHSLTVQSTTLFKEQNTWTWLDTIV